MAIEIYKNPDLQKLYNCFFNTFFNEAIYNIVGDEIHLVGGDGASGDLLAHLLNNLFRHHVHQILRGYLLRSKSSLDFQCFLFGFNPQLKLAFAINNKIGSICIKIQQSSLRNIQGFVWYLMLD